MSDDVKGGAPGRPNTSPLKRTRETQRSYAVDVTERQFLSIEARDDARLVSSTTLLQLLGARGASCIEYNGHFGASVYYTLDVEDDTYEKRAEIERLVIEYANGKKMEDQTNE